MKTCETSEKWFKGLPTLLYSNGSMLRNVRINLARTSYLTGWKHCIRVLLRYSINNTNPKHKPKIEGRLRFFYEIYLRGKQTSIMMRTVTNQVSKVMKSHLKAAISFLVSSSKNPFTIYHKKRFVLQYINSLFTLGPGREWGCEFKYFLIIYIHLLC